jgi:hypothetical protein
MTERWHVPLEQLDGYVTGGADAPTASSIEAHLVNCATCRDALAERSDPALVSNSWASIERTIDGHLNARIERAARRVGVGDREVRTLAPTVSLQAAWLAAALLALLGAAVVARRTGGAEEGLARLAFLTLAPLVPLAAVVAAISAASEPAPEVARVTPASRLRIGAIRAATAMLAAITAGLIASTALPGAWIDAVVWLIPALALSGLGALVAGRVEPTTAIGWLASMWAVTVIVAARLTADRLAAFRPGAQLLYLAIAVIAAAFIAARPDALALRSQP